MNASQQPPSITHTAVDQSANVYIFLSDDDFVPAFVYEPGVTMHQIRDRFHIRGGDLKRYGSSVCAVPSLNGGFAAGDYVLTGFTPLPDGPAWLASKPQRDLFSRVVAAFKDFLQEKYPELLAKDEFSQFSDMLEYFYYLHPTTVPNKAAQTVDENSTAPVKRASEDRKPFLSDNPEASRAVSLSDQSLNSSNTMLPEFDDGDVGPPQRVMSDLDSESFKRTRSKTSNSFDLDSSRKLMPLSTPNSTSTSPTQSGALGFLAFVEDIPIELLRKQREREKRVTEASGKKLESKRKSRSFSKVSKRTSKDKERRALGSRKGSNVSDQSLDNGDSDDEHEFYASLLSTAQKPNSEPKAKHKILSFGANLREPFRRSSKKEIKFSARESTRDSQKSSPKRPQSGRLRKRSSSFGSSQDLLSTDFVKKDSDVDISQFELEEGVRPLLVHPCEQYLLEFGVRSTSLDVELTRLRIVHEEFSTPYVSSVINSEYRSYIGRDSRSRPVIIMIQTRSKGNPSNDGHCRAVVHTVKGPHVIQLNDRLDPRSLLLETIEAFSDVLGAKDDKSSVSLSRVRNVEFAPTLLELESKLLIIRHKIGVLYRCGSQNTDDELYSNVEGSPAFEDFLTWLGTKISLEGWDRYTGGLDTRGRTGTHSIFTSFFGREIMFHVSTYLPYQKSDSQRIERKRHIGNDMVVIIFDEGTTPFNPNCMISEFNHVFIIISPVKSEDGAISYRMAVAIKDSVKPFPPYVPYPAVFERTGAFRTFLLHKIVNAEMATYQAPVFSSKLQRARREIFEDVITRFSS